MPRYADLVEETTTTTGTGDITLAGASAAGLRTFNAAVGTNRLFSYAIGEDSQSEWEVGMGYLSGSTTLVRQRVHASSNAGALVNFSAGTKRVRLILDARSLNRGPGMTLALMSEFRSV